MQPIIRIFFTIGAVLAIGVALWFSITILGFLLIVGGGMVLVLALRQFLLEKGILNPTPGVPIMEPHDSPNVTVIETQFTHIEDEKLPH